MFSQFSQFIRHSFLDQSSHMIINRMSGINVRTESKQEITIECIRAVPVRRRRQSVRRHLFSHNEEKSKLIYARCSKKKKYLSRCLVNIALGLYKSQTDRVTKFTNSAAISRVAASLRKIVKCYTKSRHVPRAMIYFFFSTTRAPRFTR